MKAIYPGSFNPFHEGHLNILTKALNIFDEIYIVVTKNINKINDSNFSSRMEKINKAVNNPKVHVIINENELTIEIAKKYQCSHIIRGLRSDTDFKYELEYYDGNKFLDPNIETIYFISDHEKRKLSSTIIKEIANYKK
ncbi:phosphopantetheine adenylyltransferase [Williamsoniiplasma somnilux]|uniref:Phosphopantetheine adenylyltransferase n=1 Tax=Williamsoniiplasma somnilux TaxID=215578 RepID=A0A2K8NYV1_9MOLU|nr:pantetheine-phosphate adenylyltransferase [Williamsoniiplasma somnilux]ATZ18924.1 phosphopantetheine adenylyltransferase [Williamsoniiplasma somnilux]